MSWYYVITVDKTIHSADTSVVIPISHQVAFSVRNYFQPCPCTSAPHEAFYYICEHTSEDVAASVCECATRKHQLLFCLCHAALCNWICSHSVNLQQNIM